uniref:Serine aminopeptidase S33 domain-containing protein n=1 Tax=Corethron hystrix TaxID=216773 RepID=A0A7S1BAY4_9STRA|mmetsp:Transcript_19876/g.45122  ORF Transcript_19876/g.45122 Transcript_19876/m.45122 type:complete len:727 (+) Transcript_19876:276-2456(+)
MGNEQSYDHGGSFDLHDGGKVALPPLDPNTRPEESIPKPLLNADSESPELDDSGRQAHEQGMEVVMMEGNGERSSERGARHHYRDSDDEGNDDSDGGTGGSEGRSAAAQVGGSARSRKRESRKNRSAAATALMPEDPDAVAFHKKLGYVQMARMGYQELVNAIIRPPRADYKVESLGPPAFTFCGRRFTRTDFVLQTSRGLALQCSHWEPVERTADRIPAVIYMHGNSSARVEVIPQLSYLLSLGVAVFSFDFAGSGKSDGEFVSLGYFEREDLMSVVAHLRSTNVVSTIALWGRSMGAATSLMHGDRDPSIACMILDSPFADLAQLAEEMVDKGREQGIFVPNVVVSIVIRMIKSSVMRQANFNIKHISPIAHADKCFIPALFVAGEHDDFISPNHSKAIYERYAGDKNLIIVEGDHNSPRPKFMFDSVSIFLQTCLQIPSSWALDVHPTMNLMAPPWYNPGFIPGPPRGSLATMASQKARQIRRSSPPKPTFDEIGMGFTAERQREVQASLFKMLGQPDDQTEEQLPMAPCSPTSRRHSKEFSAADSVANGENVDDPTVILTNSSTYTGSLSPSASELMHSSTLPTPWLDTSGGSAHISVDDSNSFSYRPVDISGEMVGNLHRVPTGPRNSREKQLVKALEDLSEESAEENNITKKVDGKPHITKMKLSPSPLADSEPTVAMGSGSNIERVLPISDDLQKLKIADEKSNSDRGGGNSDPNSISM